ncbi:DUF2652 domain-containing protein [Aquimarina agarivorans]|uniref:DUF2652 domain-containing protein n=1 Tax=Aquimarina agarivorans TaxID=980584 RepID=UPI000248FAEB|nr:DUF2652 domain-containing protein [Aquimarina agarivorans]
MNTSPTLICIADISGFTEFMSDTDIELSAKVISTLLNKVIYANEIGLKVSEIEGDAVLFYKYGKLPLLNDLINQCKHFYAQFYAQLNALYKSNKNHTESENIKKMLGLKIILHYGKEVGSVQIGKNIKLMGEDVITAHRLLKNKVPIDEYLLLSENLLQQYTETEIESNLEWASLKEKETSYEHIGDITYRYINLTPLNE